MWPWLADTWSAADRTRPGVDAVDLTMVRFHRIKLAADCDHGVPGAVARFWLSDADEAATQPDRPAFIRVARVDSTSRSLVASANPLRAGPPSASHPRRPHGLFRPEL